MALKARSFCALLCVILLFSCENQSELPEPSAEESQFGAFLDDQSLIQVAQQDFEQNVSLESSGKSGDTKRQSLKKYPLWHRAHIYESKKLGKIVVAPLFYVEPMTIPVGDTDEKVSLSRLSHLFIYKGKSGKTHRQVVTRIPDAAYWENPEDGFKGKVLIEQWDGTFLKGYLIDGNKPKKLSMDNLPGQKSQTCYTVDYYTCYETPGGSTGCDFDYSETLCWDNTDSGGGDEFLDADDSGGGGGITPGGDSGSPDLQSYNRLCGGYSFRKVGNAMVVNIMGLGAVARNYAIGGHVYVSFGINCVTIGNTTNSSTASQIFNNAWNQVMIQIDIELDEGLLLPTPVHISGRIITLLNSRLGAGSVTRDICSGSNINGSSVQYCN